MVPTSRSILKPFLHGLSSLLLLIGAAGFWAGGFFISDIAKIDRIMGEMLGLALAGAFIVLGLVVKTAANNLDDTDNSTDSLE